MTNKRVAEMADINGIPCEVPRSRCMELVAYLGGRLSYSIGVNTRMAKGERKIKDLLEKDCQERERETRQDGIAGM